MVTSIDPSCFQRCRIVVLGDLMLDRFEELTGVHIVSADTPVLNYGFDITPARLVTGIITERGITKANRASIIKLFPEKT